MRAPDAMARKHPETGAPTDDFSPGKLFGSFLMLMAAFAGAAFFLELGPTVPWWSLIGGMIVLGAAGTWFLSGRGAKAFDKAADRWLKER